MEVFGAPSESERSRSQGHDWKDPRIEWNVEGIIRMSGGKRPARSPFAMRVLVARCLARKVRIREAKQSP